MIPVGIHEDVVLTTATKNDKGTLIIRFKQVQEVDPMAALNGTASTTSFEQKEQDLLIYGPKAKKLDGSADTMENIMKKIAEVKDPLNHILLQYTTAANIKWDLFYETEIDKTNIESKLQDQTVIDKIYTNITNQFIKMINPYLGESGKKMRICLIRQSAAKHYPTLRKRFLDSQPFIEPMSVPTPKVAFSKYEIEKGLNIAEPVTGEQRVDSNEAAKVDQMFNS